MPQREGQVLGTREKVTTGQERAGVETEPGSAWSQQVPTIRPKKMVVSGAKRIVCVARKEKWLMGFPFRCCCKGLNPGQKSC